MVGWARKKVHFKIYRAGRRSPVKLPNYFFTCIDSSELCIAQFGKLQTPSF